jgi:hypothetical protein
MLAIKISIDKYLEMRMEKFVGEDKLFRNPTKFTEMAFIRFLEELEAVKIYPPQDE